jgi:dipeptidyl aminopeptidase/acylaminoacyl peptidase
VSTDPATTGPATAGELPCGSWPTPLTSAVVVAGAGRPVEVRVDGADVFWAETRPEEGGRIQLARWTAGGPVDLLPDGMNARTAVHEYGGAAWWVRDGVVWFTDWTDQRLYRLEPGSAPVPLTPEPAVPRGDRYADGDVAPDGASMVCVRERHPAGGRGAVDVRNEIVRLAADTPSEPDVLVSGPDFVAAPRLSRNGRTLAWLHWDHPAMPWDASTLVVRDLVTGEETVVAGGPGESVSEPRWYPDGSLWFLSDRSDWWNLYRWPPNADIEAVVGIDAEIGVPAWTFGSARYAVLEDGRVVFARWRDGFDGLAVRHPDGTVTDLDLPFSAVSALRAEGADSVVVVAGTPVAEPGVHRIELGPAPHPIEPVRSPSEPAPWGHGDERQQAAVVTDLRPPRDLGVDPGYLSVPEPVRFPSTDAAGEPRTAHALFYPPANPHYAVPAGEAPPLLVVIHGGPTAMAVPTLSVAVQYWTSRGFAVVDVNYGGSTGYGRRYREQLRGAWGVVDVADCLAVARHLADTGRVDAGRLCIRGGSAGGYTTLAALARHDTPFAAGANHFGVADLAALAAETHKFESRYLDGLVGPWPEAREVYAERSPISHVDRFARPLIVLQGSEDEIVPPAQSEMIVDALRAKGVPVAYLLFAGEQHGFRRSENIRRALDAELSFYGQVLGFALPPDEGIEPVEIENLSR